MANIQSFLDYIKSARYGKDVRSSIVNAIDAVNTESNNSVAKVNAAESRVNTAVSNANAATASANTAATSANTAAANANEAAQAVLDEKYILTARTEMVRSGTARPTAKGNALLEKLTGDSWQRQLTGKNLANAFEVTSSSATSTIDKDGWITSEVDNSAGTSIVFSNWYIKASEHIKTNTEYALVVEVADVSAGSIGIQDDDSAQLITSDRILTTTGTYVLVISSKEEISSANKIARIFTRTYAGKSGKIKYRVSVLEDTTATADTFTYEPYCGGIPSPNPEFPQTIHSVGDSGWFDGEWLQGCYLSSTGRYSSGSTDYICNKNSIPCKSGDVIKITTELACNILVNWYSDEGYITYKNISNTTNGEYTVPNNTTKFNFSLNISGGITPSTVGHVCVTINGKYALIVDEVGKNLFDSSQLLKAAGWTENNGEYSGIVSDFGIAFYASGTKKFDTPKFKENTQYTLAFNASSSTSGVLRFRIHYTDGSVDSIDHSLINEAHRVIISKVNGTISHISGSFGSGNNSIMYIKDILLYEGAIENPIYQPYQHQRTYIPLDEPLRAIGDVKDEICYRDGKYGVLRRVGADTFDGSSDEKWSMASTAYSPYRIKTQFNKAKYLIESDNGTQSLICNMFMVKTPTDTWFNREGFSIDKDGVTYIYAEKFNTADVSLWTSFLAENNLVLNYALAEPIFTPFEDQTLFYNLQSFDEVTHVSIAGLHEELQPTITMRFPRHEDGALVTTAYCNGKKNEIRMDELTAAMLALSQS